MEYEESTLIRKGPCDDCGSSDACALYSDGHTHCFSCGKTHKGDGEVQQTGRKYVNQDLITDGQYMALAKRGLSEETCRKWGYTVGKWSDGQWVQVANYCNSDGQVVSQKVRFPNKDFRMIGDKKAYSFFGSHLWNGGKKIVITEGEIDAMSVSQVQDHKWPVVSVPNGADAAKKKIAANLQYFDKFEEVILMFDMDEPGREAAAEVAQLFSPGKCKIASLPLKDANECLVEGKGAEIVKAIWNAKEYRPDGILNGNELWEEVIAPVNESTIGYPWMKLNAITHGIREASLIVLTSGSGMGKSAVVREIMYHILMGAGQNIGMLMLEESAKRTALGFMGMYLNKPIHINDEGITDEQKKEAFDATVGSGKVFLYNHFGSTEIENLLNRIRFLVKGCGCKYIVLDHISIVVSGMGEGDERRLIDNAMTALRTLVEELGCTLFLISHLKRPAGDKGHENGAETSLSQLRGSHSIAQLADLVIGLERDQQGDTPNVTTLRVLKNRHSGETGVAGYLTYDKWSGRLSECTGPEDNIPDLPEDLANDFA